MPNWGAGLETGAQGAATGAAIGSIVPGIGTGIGAAAGGVIGGLVGLFRKKDKKPEIVDPYDKDRKRLLAGLVREQTALAGQTAGETTGYRNAAGQLRTELNRQGEADAAGAVARGMAGSELDIALTGERNRALAQGTRGLLTDAERQRQGRLGQLSQQQAGLIGQGSQTAIGTQVANYEIEQAERNARREQIAGAMKSLVLAGYYGGAGGAGGDVVQPSYANYNSYSPGQRQQLLGTRLGVA